MGQLEPDSAIRYYFVDEAGDPVLFSRRGQVLIGSAGCSRYFMLGFLDVKNPRALATDLKGLRARLRGDPYFANVPSMKSDAGKTARVFHATDDIPEVRREVFSLLLRHPVRFYAVVRDKRAILSWVRQREETDAAFHYRQNDLYDSLVRRLFKEHLHKAAEIRILFSARGEADRTKALGVALDEARTRFCRQWQKTAEGRLVATALSPESREELQAVDYCLWAVQRLFERGEDRYITFIWPLVGLIHDVDDTHEAAYGAYYNKKRPLTAAVLKSSHGV